jgi:hypothetical protein
LIQVVFIRGLLCGISPDFNVNVVNLLSFNIY